MTRGARETERVVMLLVDSSPWWPEHDSDRVGHARKHGRANNPLHQGSSSASFRVQLVRDHHRDRGRQQDPREQMKPRLDEKGTQYEERERARDCDSERISGVGPPANTPE